MKRILAYGVSIIVFAMIVSAGTYFFAPTIWKVTASILAEWDRIPEGWREYFSQQTKTTMSVGSGLEDPVALLVANDISVIWAEVISASAGPVLRLGLAQSSVDLGSRQEQVAILLAVADSITSKNDLAGYSIWFWDGRPDNNWFILLCEGDSSNCQPLNIKMKDTYWQSRIIDNGWGG